MVINPSKSHSTTFSSFESSFSDSISGSASDDREFEEYSPVPVIGSIDAIHPAAQANILKRLQSTEALQLIANALDDWQVKGKRVVVKDLKQSCHIDRDDIDSPRSFFAAPNGIYLLYTSKKSGDTMLGSGTAKKVYRAINLDTGEKASYISSEIFDHDPSLNLEEFETHQLISPTITCRSIPGSFSYNQVRASYLVERMKGDLLDGAKKVHLHLENTREIATQIVQVVHEYHATGMLHRDLKPQNFLYQITDGMPQIKLTDFGLATPLDTLFENGLGTPQFRAPEDFDGHEGTLSVKTDCFQLGMTLALLFEHQLSAEFKNSGEFGAYLQTVSNIYNIDWVEPYIGQFEAYSERWSNKTFTQDQWISTPPANPNTLEWVIYHLLLVDPKERWTTEQALQALGHLPKV